MNLSEKTMLVSLSIGSWNARKYDKKLSRETAVKHGADEKMIRTNRRLLPMESESYNNLCGAQGAARGDFYKETLPWNDDGSRILLASNYFHFCEIIREHRNKIEAAGENFFAEWPMLKENAKSHLNGLWKEEDYPDVAALRDRYYMNVRFFPLPTGADFRASIQGEDVEAIRAQIERDTQQTIVDAMRSLWGRIYEMVGHIQEQVTGGGVVREALLDNVRELCASLPRLNLTDDPRIVEVQKRIEDKLASYTAGDLAKTKHKARKVVAEEAERIQRDLAAIMGGGR